MEHNKENEAKTNRKQPKIRFFLLDADFSHYTIISVNAKKGSDASGDLANDFRNPIMLQDIRRCPHFSVNALNFPQAFPPLIIRSSFWVRFWPYKGVVKTMICQLLALNWLQVSLFTTE